MIWKTFFRVFAERSPTPYFYNEISPSRGPSFHNFDSKLAKLHFWPKRGQWDPMWSQFDSIWIKFHPNWVKLGPNEAQSIFTNSRSTAQADVMLFFCPHWAIASSSGPWSPGSLADCLLGGLAGWFGGSQEAPDLQNYCAAGRQEPPD